MSVASYEGGVSHGYMGIIMNSEEYFVIAVTFSPLPTNTGPSATVVAGMTAALITETTWLHREATQVYRTYHNVDQEIKKLIIESFDDPYVNALSDEIAGYASCASIQLLFQLLTYYAMIAPTELRQNNEPLNTPYDPNPPIKMLFQQIQEAQA
jgi:23S rRNA G2069 N7-methylase RlmK/C1962 C5-methylase RlmI